MSYCLRTSASLHDSATSRAICVCGECSAPLVNITIDCWSSLADMLGLLFLDHDDALLPGDDVNDKFEQLG